MSSTEIGHNRRYTYEDYCKWENDERWELIAGVPYCMSPAPSRVHQKIVGEIFRQFANYLTDKKCDVYSAPFDVRLPEANEADEKIATVVQPDLVVICNSQKLDDAGCRGAPDLVIEVISPATASRDNIEKLALYEKHKVREYWIVHPTERIIWVYLLEEIKRYGRPAVYDSGAKVSVKILPDLLIDISLVFK